MTTLSDPRAAQPAIVYDEPPVKPPPILAVGPLAWIRENLFRSTFDTLLTIAAGLLLIGLMVSLFGWAIGAANWFVVTRNLRLFMTGTYPVEHVWRVNAVALLCAFGIGFSIYAYLRVRFLFAVVVAVLVGLLVAVPPLVYATTAPVSSFVTAGNVDVASGTVTETPQTELAFIGRAGETVSFSAADQRVGDLALAGLAGFTDRASAGLVNAARNRATTQSDIQTLQQQLRSDLLTDSQRSALTDELNGLTVPPPVSETYAVNSLPVNIQVIDGQTMEVISDGQLEAGSPPLVLQLPQDGWYVLRKTIASEDEAAALLRATGMYPLIERNLTIGDEYVRVSDDFAITSPRPELDGDDVPMMVLTDNQYQGVRSVGDYMRLALAPFFELLGRAFVPMTLAGVVGYGVGLGISRVMPLRRRLDDRREASRSVVPWLWIVIFIWSFVLLFGAQRFGPADLGSLLARFVWVGWMFFAGVSHQRAWGGPLLALILVLGLAQASVAEGLTIERLLEGVQTAFSGAPLPDSLLGDLFGVVLWLVVGGLAARQGMQRSGSYTPRAALRAAVLSGVVWAVLLIVPPLVISAAANSGLISQAAAANLIPTVDTRRWGGLLLTLVITVVTILASFPIGVLLALGRRSALPVVRWFCTGFIELVRGVPFITVLFMAMLLVPLVNPGLSNVDNVIRAIIGSTLFSAAYLAENVRGGLQSVPPGQEEAARALGLSGLQVTRLITLPQALRAVIPALVGQCIALFKDTSLVALVGLTDLTGLSKSVIAQAEYVGLQTEVFMFIAVIYFVVSYAMAYISRRIEASGSGAARRI
jgi:His/Glu/Gln/Arg/opine family amino acid ABC transporter permease subunit